MTPTTEQDFIAIGGRGLYDAGYTNLAVRNPWNLPGNLFETNAGSSYLAQWGREYVAKRLAGAPAMPWEEHMQDRFFRLGVRQGINVHAAADQHAAQHGFATADLAKHITGVDVSGAFHAAASAPPPGAAARRLPLIAVVVGGLAVLAMLWRRA